MSFTLFLRKLWKVEKVVEVRNFWVLLSCKKLMIPTRVLAAQPQKRG
jgi:hypothetical protein